MNDVQSNRAGARNEVSGQEPPVADTPSHSSFRLLRERRFAPLFWTQACGGFNDNLFKQAMALLVAYRIGASSGLDPASLTALAGATFVAPFIFLSAFAGTLADTMDKAILARRLKLLEIVVMALGAIALFAGSLLGLFAVLFLLGCQAALFGPVKYALLPAHLKDDELVDGNALVEGATFIAILLGSILGGALIGTQHGVTYLAVGLVAIAGLGYGVAHLIPPAPPVATSRMAGSTGTLAVLREARANRTAWLSILGISWFWVVGATLLSFVPPLARDLLGGGESVASVLLAVFSVGIAVGSLLCAKQLAGEITPRPVPFAALAMTALLVAFALAVAALPEPAAFGQPAAQVLLSPRALILVGVLFALAIASGFYAVPLFALLQHAAPEDAKARMIGANNVVNALMMVAGAAAVAVLSSGLGLSIPVLALVLAAVNLAVAVILVRLLSRLVLKTVMRAILSALYHVELRGAENVAKGGERKIVIANHQSFLDGLVLGAFLPGDPVFAVDTNIAKKWWSRPFLALVDYATLDPTNPMALKSLAREVEAGRMLVIFPEGRLTVTGSLMKIYDGPGLVADRTAADLIPVRIDGVQHTIFTRLAGRVARKVAPKVTMTILAPRRLPIDPAIKGRARRKIAGQLLYDLMSESIFSTSNIDRTLFRALIDAAALNGRGKPIVEDIDFAPLTYGRLLAGAFVLGAKIRKFAAEGEVVGIMLPNSVGAVVTFFALQAARCVPAMLNVSAGAAGMSAACRIARVGTVLTSRRFVEKAKLQGVADELGRAVRLVYLEDVREEVDLLDKLTGLAKARLPALGYSDASPDDPAVILFTSGSEGTPKGVVLTHRNLQANRYQVGARIAFNSRDIVFNALPMFHSFGLTVGTLLPVLAGIKTFLYPSPLHYRIVPELIYQTNATVFFATDTFLRGYARMANPYDFHSIRIVGAGAERVSDETRRVWSERFGVRILEGYGATETGPVIAFNTPMHFKAGTVGRLMPGLAAKLEPVAGIEGAGRLLVKGPNVMAGYFRDAAPGVIEPVADGWYDTGDIVAIDGEGFVSIRGRAKRFAKIAGEMVSLGAVEDLAARVSPGHRHAAIARPDARKGEAVVLLSEDKDITREAIAKAASAAGIPEIMLPREVIAGAAIPVLGTGKTDYVTLAAEARTKAAA
jgi:acyl-[acyl-carrier-protein]-phospholipid O-acyltransferase/long-chain-fatty-acid--[acyl-carrier-protein] ligase